MENDGKQYYQYAEDVVNNKVITNVYVKLACKRFLCMIGEDSPYYYDSKKVKKVIDFVQSLTLTKGQFNNKKFILQPWQKFAIAAIYGVCRKSDGTRATTKAYIEVGRKNGKTQLIAALSLYEFLRGGSGAEVYCLASSREQASILFNACADFAEKLDSKQQYIKRFRNEIKLPITKSIIKTLAADSSRLDGVNSSFFVVDEVEVQPNNKLYSVLATSQGMRKEPLAVAIGSGGNDVNGFGYAMRQTCIEVLQNVKQDDTQFSLIYCVDSEKDIENPEMWVKANPNLNVTVRQEFLQEELQAARNNNTLQNFVYSRYFGIWTKTAETWIDDSICVQYSRNFNPVTLFNDYYVYCGVDLAAVSDLTAVAYLCVVDGIYNFYVDYYLPQDSITQSPYYEIWAKNGHLHITPDNATDYSIITEDIERMRQNGVIIKEINYDRYLSPQWAAEMEQRNFNMKVFSQTLGSFSAPTKEFERLLKNGKVIIHDNPINRWCINNVAIKEDHNQNVKPIKGQGQKNKIDGVIACIEALGGYLKNNEQEPFFSIIA